MIHFRYYLTEPTDNVLKMAKLLTNLYFKGRFADRQWCFMLLSLPLDNMYSTSKDNRKDDSSRLIYENSFDLVLIDIFLNLR